MKKKINLVKEKKIRIKINIKNKNNVVIKG
jgi:hypothetical protein